MGRQKSNAKLDREVRRESRRKLNQQRSLSNEETAELFQFDNRGNSFPVTHIGMEKEKRDRSPIEARNVNQGLYMDALQSRDLIVATGSAGSGKTLLATVYAVDQLSEKSVEKIVVTRPMLTAEEEMGFLPGTQYEKFLPYFRPVYDILRRRMGPSFLQYCLRPEIEKIEVAPFSFMRGRTFDDAVIILDEAQNVTVNQMRLFLTRVGDNSTVIINGDLNQCDLPKGVKSGLADLLERIERKQLDIPVINFTDDDCVRSPICQTALAIYAE